MIESIEVNEEYLAEVESREAAATPGPFVAKYPHGDDFRAVRIFAGTTYLASVCNSDMDEDDIKSNAEFLAHARTDVKVLLAEVRRLRAEIDASLNLLGEHRIRVCEGGGPEDVVKSLAASCATIPERWKRLNAACDIFEKNSAGAAGLCDENWKLKAEIERLRAENAKLSRSVVQ